METNGDYIRPCDLYEFAMKAILNGSLSEEDEKKVFVNLKTLDWIKQKFDTLPTQMLRRMYFQIVESIKDETMPFDIMAISCMYYNFNMIGVDTSELRELINSGDMSNVLLKKC